MSTLTKEQIEAAQALIRKETDEQWFVRASAIEQLADLLQKPWELITMEELDLTNDETHSFGLAVSLNKFIKRRNAKLQPKPDPLEEAVRRGLEGYALSVGDAGWKDDEAVQRIAAEVRKVKDGAK